MFLQIQQYQKRNMYTMCSLKLKTHKIQEPETTVMVFKETVREDKHQNKLIFIHFFFNTVTN